MSDTGIESDERDLEATGNRRKAFSVQGRCLSEDLALMSWTSETFDMDTFLSHNEYAIALIKCDTELSIVHQ